MLLRYLLLITLLLNASTLAMEKARVINNNEINAKLDEVLDFLHYATNPFKAREYTPDYQDAFNKADALIKEGASVDRGSVHHAPLFNSHHLLLLHRYVTNPKIVTFLLDYGAKINTAGYTPLHELMRNVQVCAIHHMAMAGNEQGFALAQEEFKNIYASAQILLERAGTSNTSYHRSILEDLYDPTSLTEQISMAYALTVLILSKQMMSDDVKCWIIKEKSPTSYFTLIPLHVRESLLNNFSPSSQLSIESCINALRAAMMLKNHCVIRLLGRKNYFNLLRDPIYEKILKKFMIKTPDPLFSSEQAENTLDKFDIKDTHYKLATCDKIIALLETHLTFIQKSQKSGAPA